jgi:polyisoprenyl-teichoic acid--peptidoglycan teichoic acid transferase
MAPTSARAFLHRLITAFVVAVLVAVLAIGTAFAVATRKVKNVSVVKMDPAVLQSGHNYLLIGSDSRAFVDDAADAQSFGSRAEQTGQRSDTIMVAHVNDDGSGFLVSFPRDLWVDIPGIGNAKINAAFNAGPQRVIETIEDDFKVPISHYLQVDFAGFRNIVNSIGSIPVYFPTPARDRKSGLYINTAGCHQLNGDEALAYVRSRYYESLKDGKYSFDPTSDLGRIQRQQYFLRTLASEVVQTAERKPWKAMSLVDTMLANLQRDPKLTFSSLRALAYAFHGGSADLQTLTLPTHPERINGQDALVLDDAKAAPVLARLREQGGGGSSNDTVPPGVTPASVHVAVRNGSGRGGAGATMVTALQKAGFSVAGRAENADRSDYDETQVLYGPGAQNKAKLVRAYLGGAGKLVELGGGSPSGFDVAVVIGRDRPTVSTPPTQPAATTPGKTAAPTAAATPGSTLPAVGC